jgi:hypothetical protein
MTAEYTVFLNGNYFDFLASLLVFEARPEPYRRHEKTLWTVYQLVRLGEHEVIITDTNKQSAISTKSADELKAWVELVYPDFTDQLDRPVYTKFPHPADQRQSL